MDWIKFLLVICCCAPIGNLAYKIPIPQVDILKDGFRVSIPDEPDIVSVFYMIEINEMCPPWNDFITKSTNNLWVTESKIKLEKNDKLDIYILVQHKEIIQRIVRIQISDNGKITLLPQNNDATPTCVDIKNFFKSDQNQTRTNPNCIEKGETELKFQETFNDAKLDTNLWIYDVYASSQNKLYHNFVIYNNSEENLYLKLGSLIIKPTPYPKDTFEVVNQITTRCFSSLFPLPKNCLISVSKLKHRSAPPVISAQISTINSFSFKYGRVEVRAKLPKGDWLLPYITLQPVNQKHNNLKQIRIAFALGNVGGNATTSGKFLYGGVVKYNLRQEDSPEKLFQPKFKSFEGKKHFGEDFHKYELIWTPKTLEFKVDNQGYGLIENEFHENCYISLGVSAGSHLEFSNINKKDLPWEPLSNRAGRKFYTEFIKKNHTWNEAQTVMKVDYVKVFDLEPGQA